jgi:hypothetical protein
VAGLGVEVSGGHGFRGVAAGCVSG